MNVATWRTKPETIADVLAGVIELLSVESRWCRHAAAQDAAGNTVPIDDPAACRWCLLGALAQVTRATGIAWDLYSRAMSWLLKFIPGEWIAEFNDDATHGELLHVLGLAHSAARRSGL